MSRVAGKVHGDGGCRGLTDPCNVASGWLASHSHRPKNRPLWRSCATRHMLNPDHQSPITNYQSQITHHPPPTTNHQPPTTNHNATCRGLTWSCLCSSQMLFRRVPNPDKIRPVLDCPQPPFQSSEAKVANKPQSEEGRMSTSFRHSSYCHMNRPPPAHDLRVSPIAVVSTTDSVPGVSSAAEERAWCSGGAACSNLSGSKSHLWRYVPVVTQGHLWFTESLHPFQASG